MLGPNLQEVPELPPDPWTLNVSDFRFFGTQTVLLHSCLFLPYA